MFVLVKHSSVCSRETFQEVTQVDKLLKNGAETEMSNLSICPMGAKELVHFVHLKNAIHIGTLMMVTLDSKNLQILEVKPEIIFELILGHP